jgi:hypothetical protein
MKNKYFLCAVFFSMIVFSSFAQTDKGHYLIGGDLPFSARLNNGSGVSLSPQFGYFIVDNFALGGLISLNTGGGYTGYALGPLARYYFETGNDKLKPFGQLFLGLGGTSRSGFYSYSSNGLVGNVAAGLAIFLNEHVALEPNFRIDFDSRTEEPSGTVSLNLGLQVYLP